MAAEPEITRGPAEYPIAAPKSPTELDREIARLNGLQQLSLPRRIPAYLKLAGPGTLNAAVTLGAGTLTSAMLSGAQFGYRTLWMSWLAMGLGLFMLFGIARITSQGGFRLVPELNKRYGWMIAKAMSCLVGVVLVAVAFNFGQVALGTHLIESVAETAGLHFPQHLNWPFYGLLTAWIALSYGRSERGGVAFVELFMKSAIGLILLCFTLCLIVVGVDWGAAFKGLFTPWLPSGSRGIDLFIASAAAAIGPMNWVLFHYAGLARGWGPPYEKLARLDAVFGMAAPYILVVVIVTCVFAGTLYGISGDMPQTASELSRALVPLLGAQGASFVFLLGFLAVPLTTTVGMSIACAVAVHEAMGWEPNVRSARWKACVLLPQLGLLAAFLPSPIALIIIIAAALSLTTNIVASALFLLLNDREALGKHRIQSRAWNLGILLQIVLLNSMAIMWILNRMGLWGA